MSKKYIVTWDMLQMYARKLAKHLISLKKWKGIISVSRGGLIPSAMLARELNIRFIDTICISSYDHDKKNTIKIIKEAKSFKGETLIVDDLVDTGETAKIVKKKYPFSYFVTIFAKPKGKVFVDKHVIDIPQNVWIEQPLDMDLSYVNPLCEQ